MENKKFYAVSYIGDQYTLPYLIAVTDNFNKWLIQHNEIRKNEGSSIDEPNDFNVEEIAIEEFNLERKENG